MIFPVFLSLMNVSKKKVALLHTHGNYMEEFGAGNDIFSEPDKLLAEAVGIPFYMATPRGTLRKYDPSTNEDCLVPSTIIPYDPNHPWR